MPYFRRSRSFVGMSKASLGKVFSRDTNQEDFSWTGKYYRRFSLRSSSRSRRQNAVGDDAIRLDKDASKLTVFVGAALALIVTSAIGVAAGSAISQYISEKTLNYVAGIGFIGIGIWTLLKA